MEIGFSIIMPNYNSFLFMWYYKKKRINRAYIFNKKIKDNDWKSILRSLHIKFLFNFKLIKKLLKDKI